MLLLGQWVLCRGGLPNGLEVGDLKQIGMASAHCRKLDAAAPREFDDNELRDDQQNNLILASHRQCRGLLRAQCLSGNILHYVDRL